MTNFGTNLPLPELQLAFDNPAPPANYLRSLNLDEASRVSSFATAIRLFSAKRLHLIRTAFW